jgi:hypothetical protein
MVGQILRAVRQVAIVTVLLASVVGQVWAQDEEEESVGGDYGRGRLYLGGGLVYAIPNFNGFDDNEREAESTFGFDVRAGYRWRYVAAEVNFQYYKRFDVDVGPEDETVKIFTVGPNVKGYPLDGRFQPYVLVGIGFQDTKSGSGLQHGSAGMARFGGGVELYLMPNFGFFVEGSYGLGIESDYDIIPVVGGVQFHL